MALDGQRILLGVTGGIAAYKAVLLLRLLKRAGADVKVVMTEAATEFVTPLTFESLSEHPVRVHLFAGGGPSTGAVSPIEHIDLAKWPGLIVVAPATANSIAGFAHGRADDLLATIVSAFAGPVLLAPAMNDVMWENASTQENLRALSERGFRVVPPESGDLACGYEATGRMAEPETILAAVEGLVASPWRGVRVLVSAGGTEEDIDPVRVLRNRSTGRMGFAVAEAARDLGADVTVVAANAAVPAPHGVREVRVRTGAEMARALRDAYPACDVLVMAAAVSDFRPREPLGRKRKSGEGWTLELAPTEDILAGLGEAKGARLLIGFALETDDVERGALDKLRRKHCDFIVVNNPLTEGAAFGHETNVVTVYDASGARYESAAPESKREIARRILALAQAHPALRARSGERT